MKYTEQDFETIYKATVTHISKYVFFKVQSLQDAQDLVQDVYFALYKHMLKCTEAIENPQAYITQIANNQLSKYYEKKASRPITLDSSEIDLIESIPLNFELELEVLDQITLEELWKEIDKLPDLKRNLLIARFKFDMSYVEIAKEFNLLEPTVKSIVYLTISQLKKRFNQ
jgi:RNA polymerase sigma-70 factor (ECF subfamily)